MKYLIGADPEVFLQKDGLFKSAHAMIPGTKEKPFPVQFGAVQVDGTALEFNTDPARTSKEFVHNVQAVYKQLVDMVPGYNVVARPVADFEPEYFKHQIPRRAKDLGCNPDFDAWAESINNSPVVQDVSYRTGSGHIHVGWIDDGRDTENMTHFMECCARVKQLDYYLGIYSLKWDPDDRRRALYGRAGAFRPKPYGLEYRVMSNAWLNNPLLMAWIFNAAQKAMSDFDEGNYAFADYGDTAQTIINENQLDWEVNYDIVLGLPRIPRLRKAA